MTNLNISIRKEAYEFLKSLKRNEQSFSDVILEMKGRGETKKGSKEAIMKFFGILEDKKDWKEQEKNMRNFRKEIEERLK